ncbi:MAG TPA: hypothetical protein VIO56_03105 [Methylotenera sp.]
MNQSIYISYVLGFATPIVIVLAASLRCDYLYHRKSGHRKTKSLKLAVRRMFW